ncbi:MAG: proline dehydrogenase family protein [Bacteroidota bacterium]
MKLPYALARRFVAGETLDAALPAVRDLRADGLLVTLDLLGEDVADRRKAEDYALEYIRILRVLDSEDSTLPPNISIKLSMIGQRIDRDFCVANLRRVLDEAKQLGAFVRLDMEGSDLTPSTLGIFEEVYPDYPENVGTVLQAYLHRTEADVARMCELDARIRLCKGAYKEPPGIAYQAMPEIRANYKQLARDLITGAGYPGIATHDDELIEATKTFVRAEGIAPERFEFQMLYGLRPETQRDLVREGFNVRVYVPYGTEWGPYFTRRLRERKENVWFIAKTMFQR